MRRAYIYIGILAAIAMFASLDIARAVPRPEYPRPQFEREQWVNLNGEWSYTFDFSNTGKQRDFVNSKGFDGRITVPYCPESELSGVGYTDFIEHMWYQRTVDIPAQWEGKNIFINFGAVDYTCELYVDGRLAGRHSGGSSSFSFDITDLVAAGGSHNLVLYVEDLLRSGKQTGGKQSTVFNSWGCYYTRTTGIWQTVWMEAVDSNGIESAHITSDLDQGCVIVEPRFFGENNSCTFKAVLKDGDKKVASKSVPLVNTSLVVLPVNKPKTWSPESPFLYDIELEVTDDQGNVLDRVTSYTGIRKIHVEGQKVFLNNEPYFQRLVLDQGFYPTGIWTAPTDEDLKNDILLSKAAGFNGARLHQKVFEPRFHYWADKLGYITWGEEASWGLDQNDMQAQRNFLSEWTEVVLRDRNHPSIIAWTPFNESWGADRVNYPVFMRGLYKLTKGLDPSRPFVGASGGFNVVCDIYTAHNYEQDPAKLKEMLTPQEGKYFQYPINVSAENYDFFLSYNGRMPYILDEFGGTRWTREQSPYNRDGGGSWGYGSTPEGEEEFYRRLEGMVDAILSQDYIWGYCYTQLTDVEQEQNGIYFYDRTPKFDMKRINAIFTRTKREQ